MRKAALFPIAVAVPFGAGSLLALAGTVALVGALDGAGLRGSLQQGGGEIAFKVGYCLIVAAGVLLAVGSSWFLSERWRLPSFWTILLVLVLLGAASYPFALWSSTVNDCNVNVKFPAWWIHGCD